MKRLLSILSCLALGVVLMLPAVAHAEETNIYAPFDSFEELYNAYIDAVEDGDVERQEWLLEIGESSLDAFIANDEAAAVSAPRPRYNEDVAYWIGQFPNYFSYGRWGVSSSGVNLALGPRSGVSWTSGNISNAWNATYSKFHGDSQWQHTNCMKSQFYCHAQLSAFAGSEWNLEPWKTSINPITCN